MRPIDLQDDEVRVDDVEMLLETDPVPENITRRLGVRWETLLVQLRRGGRRDLVERLKACRERAA